MDTRDSIKSKALELFNAKGLMNVTLREVAEKLEKSYGNITYHFKTKDELIRELYMDMIVELKKLTAEKTVIDFRMIIFDLPNQTFDLSKKYLFFFVDYIELKRNYPKFMKQVDKNNAERSKELKILLRGLRDQHFLKPGIDDETLDYIMELSGAVRTFFFQRYYSKKTSKELYVYYTNKFLIPYLTEEGYKIYLNALKK